MLKIMTLPMTLALAACIFLAATAAAAETQRWSVQFSDDVTVMQVSKDTEHKFVTATIASLQNAGTEQFTLSVLEPKAAMDITKTAFSIQINEGVAEINATADLPHKVLVSLISKLKDAGITKMKVAAANDSVGTPASQQ
jgi:biopolymer transport protein ExbD